MSECKVNFLDIEWTTEQRLEKISEIMAFSSRDWARIDPDDYNDVYDDNESWAIFCLACCKTKSDAIESWSAFCEERKSDA